MGTACSTHRRNIRNAYEILFEESDRSKLPPVCGRIILKWIFENGV